jgi:hypothetical protein
VQALRTRSDDAGRRALVLPLLLLGGFALVELLVLQMESIRPVTLHSATPYRALAISIPALFCLFWTICRQRWSCTIVATIYAVFLLAMEWILPLFAAEPKFGPVYQHITHFIPNGFPLLLIVPAIAIDLVLRRVGDDRRWRSALVIGPLFLLVLVAVQYPFATFLLSPWGRNAIFGSHYFSFFIPPDSYSATYRFFAMERTAAQFWTVMATALIAATLSARAGLGLGQWLLRIKR